MFNVHFLSRIWKSTKAIYSNTGVFVSVFFFCVLFFTLSKFRQDHFSWTRFLGGVIILGRDYFGFLGRIFLVGLFISFCGVFFFGRIYSNEFFFIVNVYSFFVCISFGTLQFELFGGRR